MQENIHITYEHVPRFVTADPEAKRYLDEHGYMIVANALTTEQANHSVSLLWDYLEDLGTGIDRHKVDT